VIGYKLFRKRKDGTYGPLFINRKAKLVPGVVYKFEDKPTKGFAHRPGWHICGSIFGAPHIKQDGKAGADRVWCEVKFTPMQVVRRPASQGGTWYLGEHMQIVREIKRENHT